MYRQRFRKRTADLKHTLMWYVDAYGISLSTVRRHRELLDRPKELCLTLLSNRQRANADLRKLRAHIKQHSS
jgi:hypothetical protein